MTISLIIKKCVAYPLFKYKIMQRNIINRNNDYVILMFHRIINKNRSDMTLQEGMYTDPDTFNKQIYFLINNFNIVSLEHIFSDKSFINKKVNKKPICVLTFDDGWKDFYENAYPIFKKHGVCATVFLPTDFIGTSNMFWTDKLAIILNCSKHKKRLVKDLIHSTNKYVDIIQSMKGSVAEITSNAIEILKPLPTEDIETIVNELASKWHVKYKITTEAFLSWDEIKEMYNSGLIYFGSHTKSHRILTTISDQEIREELDQSRMKLINENVVETSFIPFAYPNGNYNDRIAKMVREAGYSLAVTTKKGWNSVNDDCGDSYQLKRVGIHQDITSTNSMLACRIYGIF